MKNRIRSGFTLISKACDREQGFTLIELLIVIAILGTLAVVILLALNPVEQLARTRDSGRISGVAQLGHAVEAYATTRSVYPPTAGTGCTPASWLGCLVYAGEIQVVPAAIAYSAPGNPGVCATNVVNGFCYNLVGSQAIVFAHMESKSQNSRCAAGQTAWTVYSTSDGRGGIVCGAGAPAVGNQTFLP